MTQNSQFLHYYKPEFTTNSSVARWASAWIATSSSIKLIASDRPDADNTSIGWLSARRGLFKCITAGCEKKSGQYVKIDRLFVGSVERLIPETSHRDKPSVTSGWKQAIEYMSQETSRMGEKKTYEYPLWQMFTSNDMEKWNRVQS